MNTDRNDVRARERVTSVTGENSVLIALPRRERTPPRRRVHR
ncbi:hypothetical protein HNQ08_002556 [Deinococcus humi]|uniref:Uncharacterized protein n=1 Tax=Deinococcus humi TaxID=662880 RepID=A0A7W8JV95_9DEIO|nr:hypothetical protein [Deinococcus humi]